MKGGNNMAGALALARLGPGLFEDAQIRHHGLSRIVFERAAIRYAEKLPAWGDAHARSYPDQAVIEQLHRAVTHLGDALVMARTIGWANGLDEVTKRAADVVNQALFAADPTRLSNTSSPNDLIRTVAAESDEAPD